MQKWIETFQSPDASYSVLDIQDSIYIITKYETLADNIPIRIHVNKIENIITFKIKIGYYIELLTP